MLYLSCAILVPHQFFQEHMQAASCCISSAFPYKMSDWTWSQKQCCEGLLAAGFLTVKVLNPAGCP